LDSTTLLDLARQARSAGDVAELAFLAVNGTHALAPYRQAALWVAQDGVQALSGVVQIEENAAYVLWLKRLFAGMGTTARSVNADDLRREMAAEWAEWLPDYGLWLPFSAGEASAGGLLLARDIAWQADEISQLIEWMEIWAHARQAKQRPSSWGLWRALAGSRPTPGGALWKRRDLRFVVFLLAIAFIPVRLSVLAPGELVPANPAVIRSPIDGIIGQFQVRPNESVKAGQPLFSYDEANLASHAEVAGQALASAEAEYRQAAAQAVSENKPKALLAPLFGKAEEKRAEAAYVRELLERSRVLAPLEGIALFDDPSEWIGKPVVTGERIMRIAPPGDVEVEAWLSVGDAIPLPPGSSVSLYLSASPLLAVSARVRYMAHDAVERPDGSYAYRVRATLTGKTGHRVGLRGTARLSGQWTPLCDWVLRRPLASLRKMVGY
jgi:hypothetical protein